MFKLIVSILICLSAGFVGSIFTTPSIPTWYAGLNKPFFNPPNWIFAPVWTTLFVLMGISLSLVWRKVNLKNNLKPFLVFGFQLLLNTFWSILFFGLKTPTLALVEIIVLWLAILKTILAFKKISKSASYLLYPYLVWVTFATVLNFATVLLN